MYKVVRKNKSFKYIIIRSMAQIAIQGHPTRGKEVIQLLEMFGGKSNSNMNGYNDDLYYFIAKDGLIYGSDIEYEELNCKYTIFTLEEFEEKFPYKVGDKVSSKYLKNYKIEKIEWKGTSNRVIYKLQGMGWYSADELQPYKEETMEEKEPEPKAPILSNRYDYAEGKCGYVIPDGYEFDSIKQGFKTEIIIRPIKPQYPKDYEECCRIIDYHLTGATIIGYEKPLLENLQQLLICRDAYWKIAGKEMGLDKPWKPDWTNTNSNKYCICYVGDEIKKQPMLEVHHFLAFPTAEMRDAFFENFKDLIEQCKELL